MLETKMGLMARLRAEGRWEEADKFREATRVRLKREGMRRDEAREKAWELTAEKFPPLETSRAAEATPPPIVDPNTLPDVTFAEDANYKQAVRWALRAIGLDPDKIPARQVPNPACLAMLRFAQTEKGRERFFLWVKLLDDEEAESQCDVIGILPLMLANSVFVVGDKEQVSPSGIGQSSREIQVLIDEFLYDIPSKESYDGRASIYDLAKECFETPTCLVEHFRCVPEIIQFSNHLSYEGRIKPLRESHNVNTRPFVVAHRVLNGGSDHKVNEVEATETASLIVAVTEQPEYDGLTIGVISLVGIEQADLIDMLLRRHLSETDYAERRLLCGNAAEFQGDERHVMFLSVVDSSDGTPLPIRQTDMFKQRFNVAASRAQNQLWVVHSVNPDTELQSDDLRSRLIRHAEDPTALTNQLSQASKLAQSEFEKQVIRRLTHRNFRIAAQWQVGAFSIDIVVFGDNDKKVAIECDGDRYHTLSNLEDDHRRQLMLERLGWRFIRIRSSRFFRDPDTTMADVFEALNKLEIEAIGPVTADESGPQVSSELKERIVRRAEELRREWKEQEELESSQPVPRPPERRRRRFTSKSSSTESPQPMKSVTNTPQKTLFDLEPVEMPAASPPIASPLTPPLPNSALPKPVQTESTADAKVQACPKCNAGQLKMKEIKLYNGIKKYLRCSNCNYSKDG